MRKRKKSEEGGFNVWRSYSDMMAGVLLLFILIMCVTLFQAQKSYNESIKERDDKIALQEQYTAEILAQQSELDEKNSKLSSQDEQLDKQKKLLAELAAQLKEQQASLEEKTSLLATQQKKIDNIIGVKADVIEALQKEFSKNRVMRVLNQYCNDVYKECAENYIGGGMNNNKSGRDLFKGWIIGYLNELQANNGIKNFVADDVTVAEGNATDAITVAAYIQPVDSIEKIYMTVPVTRSSATTE